MLLSELLTELEPNQIRWIEARLTTTSHAEAARIIGVTPASMYTWTNREQVMAALKLAQVNVIEFALARLKQGAAEAVNVILDEMKNPRGASNRLRAAEAVLDRVGLPKGIDLTTGGESFVLSEEERRDSMAKFAEVLRTKVLGEPRNGWDIVDAEIEPTVVSITESSG